MMIDTAKHPLLQRVYELCLAIEQCPAGSEQTHASTLASDLLNDLAKYFETFGPITIHMHQKTQTDCDHEFTETGNPDADYCKKCGRSVWAWAFMEMP